MSAPVWPASLPCRFTATSQSHEGADNLIRSEMSVGPDKARRRSTASVSRLSGDMVMTSAQRATFATFIKQEAKDGALPFTFKDPYGTGSILVRYVPAYRVSRFGAGKWLVSLQLEVLP